MTIRKPVQNTFDRVGINYSTKDSNEKVEVANWLSGATCEVSPLVANCIAWVYKTQLEYEKGIYDVKVADFDRVRYWIAEVDQNAYSTLID